MSKLNSSFVSKRVKTPTVLQMEAVECGAAALSIVLGYYGRIVPLSQLRGECGVSRDGSKASNILKVARQYGLKAKGYKKEPEGLKSLIFPMIVFWNFNHFLVVEEFRKGKVYLNDPASGPRVISEEEFSDGFTGVVLTFERETGFKEGGKKPSLIRALRRKLVGSGESLAYVFLAGLALVIPGIVIPIFSKIFVDDVLVKGMHNWIGPLLLGMGLTVLMRGTLTLLQEYYLLRFETKLAVSTSVQFLTHVLKLPVSYFTQRYAGEVGSRVQLNDAVASLLSGRLATTLISSIMVIFYAILMLQYDLILTFIGIMIIGLNLVGLSYISRRRVDTNQRLLQENGKLLSASMNGLQQIESLKATGSESDFFTRWSGLFAKTINVEQQLGLYSLVISLLPSFLSQINNLLILCLGALRVMEGNLTMGELVAFRSLMSSFTAPVNELVNLGGTLQEIEGNINRIDDVVQHETDPQYTNQTIENDLGSQHVQLSGRCELRNISFGYSPLDPPLIEDFNLTLNPGEWVALVGGSGCGKSTISKMVCGLQHPWSGKILFDDLPRNDIPKSVFSNSLGMVDQDIFVFEGTVKENATMWDLTIPEDRLNRAFKDACIYADVISRPGGFDSELAEDGTNFSGGQLQRLEIARALVNDPTIMVLDEATSALDPSTEEIILDNLRRRGCTCLIVAHRLSTIRDCDKIIVLDQGKIIQQGTHEEMIQDHDSPYARLIQAE